MSLQAATEGMQEVSGLRQYLAECRREWEARMARTEVIESAVRAMGVAEIERWRGLVLENEPCRRWMARWPSSAPVWIGVLYSRAVEGVVYVGEETMSVESYWEYLKGL